MHYAGSGSSRERWHLKEGDYDRKVMLMRNGLALAMNHRLPLTASRQSRTRISKAVLFRARAQARRCLCSGRSLSRPLGYNQSGRRT